MEKVLDEVLKRAKPSAKERKELENFSKSVISKIKKKNFEAELEGSLAKDTWVSGAHDIDIFVFFKEDVPRKELEQRGIKLGKSIIRSLRGKPELGFAEHPYVRAKIKGITLDIVPCYKLKSTARLISAVDRTPFHTRYIQKNLSKEQRDEVRLLKQFAKGVNVYSAKEKVRGFSGYLCELLILKYKSFSKLIKAAGNWNYGIRFDLEKSSDAEFEHCMTFIDPIDMNRNVAAALDPDNFERFILASREFCENPKIEFFFPNEVKPIAKKELAKTLEQHGRFLLLKFKTPEIVEDVLYSQLRRSLKTLKNALEFNDFKVTDSAFFANKDSYFVLEFESLELPKLRKVEGPPIKLSKEYQEKFLEKYEGKESWVEEGRLYVEVPRKVTNATQMLKILFKNTGQVGVSGKIAESINKNYSILEKDQILKEYKGEFAKFLTEYLTKKKPWDW